jgi:hypothetical protein
VAGPGIDSLLLVCFCRRSGAPFPDGLPLGPFCDHAPFKNLHRRRSPETCRLGLVSFSLLTTSLLAFDMLIEPFFHVVECLENAVSASFEASAIASSGGLCAPHGRSHRNRFADTVQTQAVFGDPAI